MRKIYEVAKAELQTLFYSPIAWLIIIVFIFQVSLLFTSALELRVKKKNYQNTWRRRMTVQTMQRN